MQIRPAGNMNLFTPQDWATLSQRRLHAHHLLRIAKLSLQANALQAGFLCIDRLCRIAFHRNAETLLLRALFYRKMGRHERAERDIRRAAEMAPASVNVNIFLLDDRDAGTRELAASRLVGNPAITDQQRIRALGLLSPRIEARVQADETILRGWASWPADKALVVRTTAPAKPVSIGQDPLIPQAIYDASGHRFAYASFAVKLTKLDSWSLHLDRREIYKWHRSIEDPDLRTRRSLQCGGPVFSHNQITVLVPVYRDLRATKACLSSLLSQHVPGTTVQAVVIDDNSPEPELSAYVKRLAEDRLVELLSNSSNLGFARSVNRGAIGRHGDVVILNSDTVLPEHTLWRLAEAAHSSADIGTVTPLSNNGEDTSFPQPYTVAEERDTDVLIEWADAARALDLPLIDIPNGVGFCLYVNRSCWQKAGPLPVGFGRGYYEDVAFCLKAATLGFRNVCAPSIFVIHEGSRSFSSDKHALVAKNAKLLKAWYPGWSAASAAFSHQDPIRRSRGRIEELLRPEGVVSLVVGWRTNDTTRAAINRMMKGECSGSVIMMTCDHSALGLKISLGHAEHCLPKNIVFDYECEEFIGLLSKYFSCCSIDKVIICSMSLPDKIIRFLVGVNPFFIFCFASLSDLCDEGFALKQFNDATVDGQIEDTVERLINKNPSIDLCIVTNPVANSFAERFMTRIERRCEYSDSVVESRQISKFDNVGVSDFRLGIVAGELSTEVLSLVRCLDIAIHERKIPIQLIVVGGAINDYSMFSCGVFVSGPVELADCCDLAVDYDLSAIMSPYRFRANEAAWLIWSQVGMPICCFDWSFGSLRLTPRDCALSPTLDDGAFVERMLDWCEEKLKRHG